MSAFRVGMKVVYVGGGWRSSNQMTTGEPHEKGVVYTVRGLLSEWIPFCGVPGLLTTEIVHPLVQWNGRLIEPAIAADNFRPAVDQFDFHKLVTPAELSKFKLDESSPSKPVKVET